MAQLSLFFVKFKTSIKRKYQILQVKLVIWKYGCTQLRFVFVDIADRFTKWSVHQALWQHRSFPPSWLHMQLLYILLKYNFILNVHCMFNTWLRILMHDMAMLSILHLSIFHKKITGIAPWICNWKFSFHYLHKYLPFKMNAKEHCTSSTWKSWTSILRIVSMIRRDCIQ